MALKTEKILFVLHLVLKILIVSCTERNKVAIRTDRRSNAIVWFDPFISVEDIVYLEQYDENRLTSLIQQISRKFHKVLIGIQESESEKRNYSSLKALPKAIAKFNGEKIRPEYSNLPLEVWLVDIFTEGSDSEERLKELKKIGDEANAIYDNTVPVIMEYYKFAMSPDPLWLSKVSRVRESYKFGLILPINRCFSAESDDLFREYGKHIDILFFAHSPTSEEVEEGDLERFLPNLTENFVVCQRMIRSFTKETFPVGFVTEWPDTSESGKVNYTNLVSYWNEMSAWSKASRVPVILRNAFDTAYESNLSEKTRGWWKVDEVDTDRKTVNYYTTFNFIEKANLVSESEEIEKLGKNLSWLQEKTVFSRENIIVRFDPFVSNGGKGVWESGAHDGYSLTHLFHQLSSQVSKVILHEMNLYDGDRRLALIPKVVAKIKRFNNDPVANLIDVIPTVTQLSNWNMTKAVADDANAMNPGTVNTIMIQVRDEEIPQDRLEQLKIFFQYGRQHSKIGNTSGKRYRIAGMFLSDKCFIPETSLEFMKELAPLIRYLDAVYFMELIDTNSMKLGVARIVAQLTTRFLNCKRKILKVSPRIDVGLLTGWSDTDSFGNQNYAQQVRFWEMINEFALRTNTSVIFLEAFDALRKKEGGHLGLFRLIANDNYKSVSEYVFEDKRALALKAALGKTTLNTSRNLTTLETIGIALVVILVVGFVILSLLLIFRRQSGSSSKEANHLTREEIQEFFDGADHEDSPLLLVHGSQEDVAGVKYNKPYDKEQYEFIRNTFFIDDKSILGSGEFGKVCRGKVILERVNDKNDDIPTVEEVAVAVKMVKRKCSDPKTALKGLLSEIKILSYLGMHENIVGLIGAHTASLSKNNAVFLFLEICSLGSLDKYLKKHEINKYRKTVMERVSYKNVMKNELIEDPAGYVQPTVGPRPRGVELSTYENVSQVDNLIYLNMEFVDISKDLYRWAEEIGKGMEFLAGKNVIHADLATRNVLLTGEKKAKISDFGLSRRLYDYNNYVKSKQEPLPWRWMAPESLRKLEFNEKTDVWSYGVTLWEIFTCGEIPYPGLNWNVDFCNDLENGLRMSKPLYCNDKIYKLMLKCWAIDGENRPTFTEINDILGNS